MSGAIGGAVAGFVGGAITSGSLKGALQGAFSGALFGGIGGALGNAHTAVQVGAHALAGGVISTMQGGKFGHGFFSAGFTKWAGKAWSLETSKDVIGNSLKQAIIGGTASKITDNKFANGAFTAALQYIVNEGTKTIAGRVEATAQARKLNAQGGDYTVVQGQDGSWTIQRRDMAALERSYGVAATNALVGPGTESMCRVGCGALAAAIAATGGGDYSDAAGASLNNDGRAAIGHAETVADILQTSSNPDVKLFGRELMNFTPVTRAALMLPASVNNYQQCFVECMQGYRNRVLSNGN